MPTSDLVAEYIDVCQLQRNTYYIDAYQPALNIVYIDAYKAARNTLYRRETACTE